jgi:hypothetical protein
MSIRLLYCALGLGLVGLVLGCEQEEAPSSYVARVGDHYLTQNQLDRKLEGMGPVPDSTQARQQVIEQWGEKTLLYREAQRLNLGQDDEVQRLLDQRRRSTLVSALTNRIYDNLAKEPTDEDIRTYFERHRAQLAIRQPFVRVRHLTTTDADSAQRVRRELLGARDATIDSLWATLTTRYAENPTRAQRISTQHLPEGRLFAQLPFVKDELSTLQEGQVARVIEDNNRFHVLQLVRRIPEGTEPELHWMKDEIRRRLRIRHRKQMYAREVQRLRNRATAENAIETP